MEIVKEDRNTEFDVLYSDGAKTHVQEGLLLECKDSEIILHLGTRRLIFIFVAIKSLFKLVDLLGLEDKLQEYLDSAPEKDADDDGVFEDGPNELLFNVRNIDTRAENQRREVFFSLRSVRKRNKIQRLP